MPRSGLVRQLLFPVVVDVFPQYGLARSLKLQSVFSQPCEMPSYIRAGVRTCELVTCCASKKKPDRVDISDGLT